MTLRYLPRLIGHAADRTSTLPPDSTTTTDTAGGAPAAVQGDGASTEFLGLLLIAVAIAVGVWAIHRYRDRLTGWIALVPYAPALSSSAAARGAPSGFGRLNELVTDVARLGARVPSGALRDRLWRALVSTGALDRADESSRFEGDPLDVILERTASQRSDALIDELVSFDDYLAGDDRRALRDLLAGHGVRAIAPEVGEPFDGSVHFSVGVAPTDTISRHDTIAEVVRAGFADERRVRRDPEVVVFRIVEAERA